MSVTPPDWATQIPNYPIHDVPARAGGMPTFPLTWQQLQQIVAGLVNEFLRQVAVALGAVEIFGFKPYDALVTIGGEITTAKAQLDALIAGVEGTGITDVVAVLQKVQEILDGLANALGLLGTGHAVDAVESAFSDLRSLLGNPSGLGTGSPTVPSLADIPLLGVQVPLSDSTLIDQLITNFQPHQWFTDLRNMLGNPTGWGTGGLSFPPLNQIPLLGTPVSLSDIGPATEILNGLTPLQWFQDLQSLVGMPTGLGTGTVALPSVDDIPVLGPIIDTITTQAGSAASDIENMFQHIAKDGSGLVNGVGILHDFGLDGNVAHTDLWDTICNALGIAGSGHGYSDAGNALNSLNKKINELINGKKAVLAIFGTYGTYTGVGGFDPSAEAPWLVDGDMMDVLALGAGGGGAGGTVLLPGVGAGAGSWSTTTGQTLVFGTDCDLTDTFDYVVGRGGFAGAINGGSGTAGQDSTITLHRTNALLATGSGGAAGVGNSGTTGAWWGQGVSPRTVTINGTDYTGGANQIYPGAPGHSSGGGGAGGSSGFALGSGSYGASGLVAFLVYQA